MALAQEPDPAKELLNTLTVAEKIGQLFVVPFVGDDTGPNSDIAVLITEYKIGGVVLQASNRNFINNANTPQQIANLTNKLQAQTLANKNIPLFIAVDHEGDGWPYTRITGGVTPIPSAMSIGATWNLDNAHEVGQIVGQELSAMGINMLLGPVLDVLNNPRPTGRGDMGTRTFGGDPFWVGAMGQAYIQGVHEGSNNTIATVAKHFPGHGGSDRLPDNEVATVDKSLQELKRIELAPFFAVTQGDNSGVTDAMMSSHIRYRGFQGDIRQFTAPISFDAAGMTTLLQLPEFVPWRNAGGLIVSDALGVPAVRKHYDPSLLSFPHRRIAREAFLAGNDLLILAQFDLNSIWSQQFENIKDTIEFFRAEYNNNSDFAARIDESVIRILRLKLKLFPNPGPNALFVDGEVALAISGRGNRTVNRIAQQSLTLLYPSPAEYELRLPRPPGVNEKLLVVTDSRLVRECFDDICQPFEPLPYNALEQLILKLYGPETTGQVLPENIASINFAELKQVLVGSLARFSEETEAPEATQINRTSEEVATLIQGADWIIFITLDLNTDRYQTSDALKLFLTQGLSGLQDKKLLVFALNSPYYLDTTEVNKLTAYFGLYSKTGPHLEVATRALFGETTPPGKSPVNVEGIGYDLVSLLAPDPIRSFPVQVQSITPSSLEPPVSVVVQAGPVLDHNGHPVPDGTPVEFEATYSNGQKINIPITATVGGLAETTITLLQAGSVEIFASSGEAKSQRPQVVTALSPAETTTPTPPTATPTSTPTSKPATPSPLPTKEPTTTPIPTAVAVVAATFTPVITATPAEAAATVSQKVSGGDFLIALLAISLTVGIGVVLWSGAYPTPSQRTRLVLITFIGGMIAYLLYGIGWLRPDLWFSPDTSTIIRRMTLSALVVIFGLLGSILERRIKW
jgi:beta-N-acetylhexosaminidase